MHRPHGEVFRQAECADNRAPARLSSHAISRPRPTLDFQCGAGTRPRHVLRIEGRTVQVAVPDAGVMRHYALQSAPLTRAEFRPGERITGSARPSVHRDASTQSDGLLHLSRRGDARAGGELDDVQTVSQGRRAPDQPARVDRNDASSSACEALRAARRRDALAGVGVTGRAHRPDPAPAARRRNRSRSAGRRACCSPTRSASARPSKPA